MKDIKFDLNDIVLIPSEETKINSRSECDTNICFNNNDFLPLFAAPMDTVISSENYQKFIDLGIIPCIPRGLNLKSLPNSNFYFQSFSLQHIEDSLNSIYSDLFNYENILIDIANAHMKKIVDIVKEIKKRFPDVKLMVGNVANPETFANLGLAGADFVRCSIGSGNACTTAANVSINYPMGSLITECKKIKTELNLKTKIVADGGMKNYSDIIKAIGLGADFVMVGSLFNKSIESAGFNYLYGIKISNNLSKKLWKWGFSIKKKYRGMSTKSVQKNWGKSKLTTSEGITKFQKVEYTLEQWVENFRDYLKSAMSYCNAKKLSEFIGHAQYVFITENARKRFDK